MLATHGGYALAGCIAGAELAGVPRHDRFAEFGNASGGGIAREVALDGPDGGLLDVLGGREVRLARAKRHHVDARPLQPAGLRRDSHGGGLADPPHAF